MQQEKEHQEEVDELYRILAEESKEFQEYLDILEALPQEPLFPPVSVESGNTTSLTPNGELEHA